MLVVSRRRGESIAIGNDITLTVVEVRGDKIRLAVTCPAFVPVYRHEVYEAIHGSCAWHPPPQRSAEEQAFVQTILESSDDEGIRLIFADWLEEHDDPLGEFIRTQCQLAHLSSSDERRTALEQRERRLWDQNERRWRAYLPASLRYASFERGFVESVQLSITNFLQNSQAIFAAAPVRRLLVQPEWAEGPSQTIAALAASPYFARLSEIDLGGLNLEDHEAVLLAESPHAAGLRSLLLPDNGIATAGAVALASSPHLTGLEVLDLRYNPLGMQGVWALHKRFGSRVRIGGTDADV